MQVGKKSGSNDVESQTYRPSFSVTANEVSGGVSIDSQVRTEGSAENTVSYQVPAQFINEKPFKKGISWLISKIENPGDPVQYLYRSYPLSATFDGSSVVSRGRLVLRPTGFSIFDASGKERTARFRVMVLLWASLRGHAAVWKLADPSTFSIECRKDGNRDD